ncbi:MAG: right-handed parallel beta-helix repeat-containing protein [archaeon]|nr:right-handed parallel beta-helix repeat-containing protein [archaeon]
MKKVIVLCFVFILLIPIVLSANQIEKDDFFNSIEGQKLPGPLKVIFGNEKVNLYVTLINGGEKSLGIIIVDGVIKDVQTNSLDDQTMNVWVKELTLKNIVESKKPLLTLQSALDNEEIRYEAVSVFGKFKTGVASLVINVISLFDGDDNVDDQVNNIREENYAEVEISSCGDPENGWQENTRYVITADINVDMGVCFEPTVSNIILDGNSHSLTGNQRNKAIQIRNLNNLLIYNFEQINSFDSGIYLRDSDDIRIQSLELLNNNFGVRSEYSDNVQIINAIVLKEGNPGGNGLFFNFGSDNTLNQNTLRNLASGISLQGLEGVTTVSGNRIYGSLRGISLFDVINGSVEGNTIEQPRIAGIILRRGDGNRLNNNVIRGGSGDIRDNPLSAIYLEDTRENTIQGNIVEDTFLDGLELEGSSQNIIRDNVIQRNSDKSGVVLSGSSGNNFNGNIIERNFIGFNSVSSDPTLSVRLDNNIICDNIQTDLSCLGLRAGQGVGNFMSTFEGCPVQSWPLEGTSHQRCSAR